MRCRPLVLRLCGFAVLLISVLPLPAFAADNNGDHCTEQVRKVMAGVRDYWSAEYQQIGGLFVWEGVSAGKCARSELTEGDDLSALLEAQRAAEAAIGADIAMNSRFCKLFVASDVESDPREVIRKRGLDGWPRRVMRVSQIEDGARYAMECILGVRGVTPAAPTSL